RAGRARYTASSTSRARFRIDIRGFLFLDVQLNPLTLDVEPEPDEQSHVDVGHPDEGQPRDEEPRPPVNEQPETGKGYGDGGDVVAEAVLAAEHVKKLARNDVVSLTALLDTPRVQFGKQLLMRDRPGGARNRNSQHKKPHDLGSEGHRRGV